MAVKVMIADDHSMIREGLKQLLELEGDFEVIAEACDGVDCLEKLKTVVPELGDVAKGINIINNKCHSFPFPV